MNDKFIELKWICSDKNIPSWTKLKLYIEYLQELNAEYIKTINYLYENYVKKEKYK